MRGRVGEGQPSQTNVDDDDDHDDDGHPTIIKQWETWVSFV